MLRAITNSCKTIFLRLWESMDLSNYSKGAPARESRTGTRLVSPAASREKKKLTPAEQGLRTSNLVH
jgi:hypothetical protein